MPDHIVTTIAGNGTVSIVAGITTELVTQTQQRHHLAPTVGLALGRLITGAALLGATLKAGGERISLQIAGEGPLRTLVADVWLTQPKQIGARAYASVSEVELPVQVNGRSQVALAIGKGWLQVTRSYEVGQPYVGIVPLASGEISDDIALYLLQSEQVPSVVTLGVPAHPDGSIGVCGGVIAQAMPGADETTIEMLNARAHAMPSVTGLIEAGATAENLAQSLAGDLQLRMLDRYEVSFQCRCTREKVALALMSLGRDELAKLIGEQEETIAVCEFCKAQYLLSHEELAELIAQLEQGRE
jgi:molecular chaperone Hsp33